MSNEMFSDNGVFLIEYIPHQVHVNNPYEEYWGSIPEALMPKEMDNE